MKHWSARRVAACVLVAVMLLPTRSFGGQDDPAINPGRDPGGYKVAIIGEGIDYTLRNIGQMLARDGEGEIIGYDFRDDDRRPFSTGAQTDAAEILLAEGQAATLVAVRTDVLNQRQFANAISYAAQSPARIIAVFAPASETNVANVLAAAAQKFPNHLFLAAIEDGVSNGAGNAQDRAANLLIVTNAPDADLPALADRDQEAYADLAISATKLWERSAALPEAAASPGQIALARTAALAARIQAVETQATAAGLKTRITALAKPLAPSTKVKARFGWIAEPRRHFWLE